MKYRYMIILALLATACSDWLDVSPRIQIKESENFKSPQGYKDALTGIYLLMTEEKTYGRELSFGLTDVLAKQYTTAFNASNEYYYFSIYDYAAQPSKSKITTIWSGMYNILANVNNLIAHLDEADPATFTGDEYHIIRGEAYGLRAFLHFDLVRLFGPSYLASPDARAIPYTTAFNNQTTPLSTVRQVIDKALADLTVAAAELQDDPVMRGESSSDHSEYIRNRHYHFNYYAVKLLQARIWLYAGNHRNALAAAEEVIGQELFTWVPQSEVATSSVEQRNLVFYEELIFSLNVNNIIEIAFGTTGVTSWFTANGSGGFNKSIANWNTTYENAKYPSDYRYLYLTSTLGTSYATSQKLYQPTAVYGQNYLNKMPIMRLSEAYYIAAECALNLSDKEKAVSYFNEVREHRYINDPLGSALPADAIQEEIRKEYAKEFICEGQLFYYYKRLNHETIQFYTPGATGVQPRDAYVLPLPDEEIEYGHRYLEE